MKLTDTFRELRLKHEAALILYLTAGYPDMKQSLDMAKIMIDHGADIIEIGLPFSDPIADGPTIQKSSQEALKKGSSLKNLLKTIVPYEFKVPLVLMSYLNPLLSYGDALFTDLHGAGFSGLIIPDLPVEEAETWISGSRENGIDLIFLVAPVSDESRIRLITEASAGFIYCVTSLGTTGIRETLPDNLTAFLESIRNATDKPIAAGFGISSPEQIRQLRDQADGIIIGSRIIEAIQSHEDLGPLVKNLKQATQHSRKGKLS